MTTDYRTELQPLFDALNARAAGSHATRANRSRQRPDVTDGGSGMTPLSPAAQAVLDAFGNASDGEYVEGVWVVNERTMLAAALCAAADQVTPPSGLPTKSTKERTLYIEGYKDARLKIREELLAIAAELAAQP